MERARRSGASGACRALRMGFLCVVGTSRHGMIGYIVPYAIPMSDGERIPLHDLYDSRDKMSGLRMNRPLYRYSWAFCWRITF